DELRTLRTALEDKINVADETTHTALARAAKAARTNVDALIADADTGRWQATFEKWLRPPVRAVVRISARDTREAETLSYCDGVVRPFDDLVAYYPFNPKTPKNATVESFAEYFKPDEGKVWAFYTNVLATRVRKTHDGYEVEPPGATERNKVNPQLAKFLTRASDVTRVMFPDGGGEPNFEFKVLVTGSTGRGVEKTIFKLDGQKVTYRNTPLKFHDMHWPGDDSPVGGFIKVNGLKGGGDVTKPYDWGFLMLLEAGTTRSTGDDRVFTFRWDLTDQDAGVVTIKFEPKVRDTPIFGVAARPLGLMEVFRHADLTPPRRLFVGGSACER
ncbi:MAG: type VI secretion IcmF C-terminal domain-containing protein, partial [Myxococcota bacterium]